MSLLVNPAQSAIVVPTRLRSESAARASETAPVQQSAASLSRQAQVAAQQAAVLKTTRKQNSEPFDDANNLKDSFFVSLRQQAELGGTSVNTDFVQTEQAGRFDIPDPDDFFEGTANFRQELPLSLSAKNAVSSYSSVERLSFLSQSNISQIVGVDITI